MSKDELRNLKVGDKVRWVSLGGECDGVVVEKSHGFAHIVWADGKGGKLVIGWRSQFDRDKGKNIVLLPSQS